MRRSAAVLAALLLASSTSSAFAQSSSGRALLEEADAVELANKLAEATEDQDVCYGWSVTLLDEDRGYFNDEGSSYGPSVSPTDPRCAVRVVLRADILYTSSLLESPDSASVEVESTVPGLQLTAEDLRPFGVTGTALLGDDDDLALLNGVAALPLLVAEAGVAPPVQPEQTTGTIPDADRPTGTPGSDRFRTYSSLYFFAIAMIVLGLLWVVAIFFLRNAARDADQRRTQRDPNHTGAPRWNS